MSNLEFITCESGDWEVIKLNGEVHYEGHKVPSEVWLSLLKDTYEIKENEVSDDDMESGNI